MQNTTKFGKATRIVLSCLTLSVLLGCKEENIENAIDFKFVLKDTLGNEKTEFNQGENIIFSFVVINKSTEDWQFEKFLSNNDFFRVYQNKGGGIKDLGKPYKNLFCEFKNVFFVKSNEIFKVEIPWSKDDKHIQGYIGCSKETYHSDVSKLDIGNYYTEFNQLFKTGENKIEKNFKIEFTVK